MIHTSRNERKKSLITHKKLKKINRKGENRLHNNNNNNNNNNNYNHNSIIINFLNVAKIIAQK